MMARFSRSRFMGSAWSLPRPTRCISRVAFRCDVLAYADDGLLSHVGQLALGDPWVCICAERPPESRGWIRALSVGLAPRLSASA